MNMPTDTPTEKRKILESPWVRGTLWILLALFFIRFIDNWPALSDWLVLFNQNTATAFFGLGILFIGATVFRTLRWQALLRASLPVGFVRALAIFGWSFFLMTLTPFRAGELLRPAWVRKQGGSFLFAVGVLVVERLADMTLLVVLLALAISANAALAINWPYTPGLLVIILLTSGYFLVSLLARPIQGVVDRRLGDSSLFQAISRFLSGLARVSDFSTCAITLSLTAVIWGLLALGYHLVLTSLFPDLHWSAALLVLAAVNLTGLLWISPGNIGLYEAAAVLVLTAYGIPSDIALVAAIGLHATILGLTLLIGLLSRGLFLLDGGHWKDLV